MQIHALVLVASDTSTGSRAPVEGSSARYRRHARFPAAVGSRRV